MHKNNDSALIKLHIETIAYGGRGIARSNDTVYFVEGTLPGEEVVARIIDRKKNFAVAQPQDFILLSPERIPAPCPYFNQCGGCCYQHASYSLQLTLKRQQVLDALTRIGKLAHIPLTNVIPSPLLFHYRNRITLHHDKSHNGIVGFYGKDNVTILPIRECLLGCISLNQALPLAREILKSSPRKHLFLNDLILTCDETYVAGLFVHQRSAAKSDTYFLHQYNAHEINTAATAKSKPFLTFHYKTKNIMFSPYAFFQTNPAILSAVGEELERILTEGIDVLIDCYCGVGVLACMVSGKSKRVIAIEENPAAAKMAQRNIRHNNLTNITILNQKVETALPVVLSEHKAKLRVLLLDPPRSGLSDLVLKTIISECPNHIAYLSCEPTTLARDLALLQSSYSIEQVIPFDMFPHTKHIEVLTFLRKK